MENWGWGLVAAVFVIAYPFGVAIDKVLKELRELNRQVGWLRRELKAGLGVTSDDVAGWTDGSFLKMLSDAANERRRS